MNGSPAFPVGQVTMGGRQSDHAVCPIKSTRPMLRTVPGACYLDVSDILYCLANRVQ